MRGDLNWGMDLVKGSYKKLVPFIECIKGPHCNNDQMWCLCQPPLMCEYYLNTASYPKDVLLMELVT